MILYKHLENTNTWMGLGKRGKREKSHSWWNLSIINVIVFDIHVFYKKVRILLINKNFLKKSVILLMKSFLRILLFLNFIAIINICYRNIRNVRNVIYKNFLNFRSFYIYFLKNYFLIRKSMYLPRVLHDYRWSWIPFIF